MPAWLTLHKYKLILSKYPTTIFLQQHFNTAENIHLTHTVDLIDPFVYISCYNLLKWFARQINFNFKPFSKVTPNLHQINRPAIVFPPPNSSDLSQRKLGEHKKNTANRDVNRRYDDYFRHFGVALTRACPKLDDRLILMLGVSRVPFDAVSPFSRHPENVVVAISIKELASLNAKKTFKLIHIFIKSAEYWII